MQSNDNGLSFDDRGDWVGVKGEGGSWSKLESDGIVATFFWFVDCEGGKTRKEGREGKEEQAKRAKERERERLCCAVVLV